MDDLPRETPSTWNSELGSDLGEGFLHSIVENSLMCLFHDESGEVMTSWHQNRILGLKQNFSVSQSATTMQHPLLVSEGVELFGQIIQVCNRPLSTLDPQYLSLFVFFHTTDRRWSLSLPMLEYPIGSQDRCCRSKEF